MDAQTDACEGKVERTGRGGLRLGVSAVALSLVLGACDSVPDAVNPVTWYEKTADFFAGDSQADAAGEQTADRGLSADPNAPPPAPAPSQQVASAPSGLSADQMGGNYASPPIERQGAARDVYVPGGTAVAGADTPPSPMAAPSTPVMTARETIPAFSDPAVTPPAPPSLGGEKNLAQSSTRPTMLDTPPEPFEFPPVNPMGQYGNEFDTVVITGEGMADHMDASASMRGGFADAGGYGQGDGYISAAAQPMAQGVATDGMLRVATIHFANNAANLDARDRSILDAVIQLQQERGGQVVVIGHASARTRDMDFVQHQMVNFEISMQRATVVADSLKRLGLSETDMQIHAVADTQPLFLEVMPSGEAGNRRVEIYLADTAT
ncbi:MAG: OmpA family protein [Alphaproteobacteria bacterium]|nr:OmpA family protein [Alphaproteobacteria bacterium]